MIRNKNRYVVTEAFVCVISSVFKNRKYSGTSSTGVQND